MTNVILTQIPVADLETIILNSCRKAIAEISIPPASANDDITDLNGAAQILKVTPATIYSYVYKKAIPVMKRRGRLYFSKAALTEWITSSQRKSREEIRQATVEPTNG